MYNESSDSILHSINIGFWNISGLQSKLDGTCPDVELNSFIQFIETFHVMCFLESWGETLNQFTLEGYRCYESIRKKHAKAFRNSGGLAVFIKHELYDIFNISRESSESNNLIWLKFDIKPQYWNVTFNFICGFVYMSPEGSSVHSEENLFFIIENEMGALKRKFPLHKFVIGGDFNAYTNDEPDFIQFDSTDYILDDFDYIEDEPVPDRKNLDSRDSNAYGTALLELCKGAGLRIVNGRLGKDANIGNYTCITRNSSSVIDYLLADLDFFRRISDFEIHERIESIHMPVRVQISCTAITSDVVDDPNTNNQNNARYYKYIFNEEKQQ